MAPAYWRWRGRSGPTGRTGPPGALAFHIVDVMASITESIDTGAFVDVTSTVEVAAILPDDWDVYAATL